jgi:four helix bundle protein
MSKADDLQQRVESFADAVVVLCEPIHITAETERHIGQLIGAATSVAANYRAARRARSHAEFTARIGVVAEEADESEYWLGRAVRFRYGDPIEAKRLHEEALELTKIFARSAGTARSRRRK